MKILVTGGSGIIGKYLIDSLSEEHEITSILKDKIKNPTFSYSPNVKIDFADITSKNLNEIIEDTNPDIVIHLASRTGLKNCEEDPKIAFQTNVFGTYNVIKSCIRTNSKLIFFSSKEVYGESDNLISEDSLKIPKNVYGLSKMLGENLVLYAHEKLNLDYVILRVTNVFDKKNKHNGLNKILYSAKYENKIDVYGGDQILSPIYIEDLVDIVKLIIENEKTTNQIFNVGSKEFFTLKEIIQQILIFSKKKIQINYLSIPNFENKSLKINSEKSEKILNFKPKYKLKNIIEEYFKE